jgi:hypothetical protein
MMKKLFARLIPVFLFLMIMAAPTTAQLDFLACDGALPQTEIAEDCLDMMTAFPAPTVIPVPQDTITLDNYAFWHVTGDNPNVFDAPGGNVVRQMGEGFNFVRVIGSAEGWKQIETGEWMLETDIEYYEPSYFRGVRILNGLETRFAWVLGDQFAREYPGGKQDADNGRLLFRYDLVNIYAEVIDEDGWYWYMIGPNQWIEQRNVARVFKIERPEGVVGRWVAVDLYEQTVVAYEDDTPVFATLVSTGLPGSETNEGIHEIWATLDRDGMSGSVGAPDGYALQSVPWVMYFDESISLHGTYWHDIFGYRSSRGCVNMSISDSAYVYGWFRETIPDEEGVIVNYVYVHSSGEYGAGNGS